MILNSMENSLRVDFKVVGCEERGIFYSETNRAIIYLNSHESLDDIYQTIQHEVIHYCLRDMEDIDELQEESVIFSMAWGNLSIS